MSKPVKNLISEAYKSRFGDINGAILVEIRGTTSNDTNDLRAALAQKNIKVTVVKNALAKSILGNTQAKDLSNFLSGANALVYPAGEGVDALGVARELAVWAKKIPTLQYKGAFYDGVLYEGQAGVEQLSKLPTRAEAQGNVVTLLLSPGSQLIGILDAIKTKLEAGAPAAAAVVADAPAAEAAPAA